MTESVKPRQTYLTVSQLGPDWQPAGVPSMYTQIVPITPDQGYGALTHNVASPGSGYFNETDAYDNEYIKVCGYKFLKRACDGTLPLKKN
jgi:hypothetical protein